MTNDTNDYLELSREELTELLSSFQNNETEFRQLHSDFLVQLKKYQSGKHLYTEEEYRFYIDSIEKSISSTKSSYENMNRQIQIIKNLLQK
ncbi:hypothetical protein PSTEL_13230 [Paenibacillus stellifer]|uniref:Uncharacterized protein n=1 Tax=Paenibacillus stellifer TaxID=169760 RepID=A0A089LQW4_9BACL|nr:hypothetical protein [Paenibacillus stellifer]AIQ63901.1 hypothetical protein PSTEL_13230 [Paenibacillus stellifer]